MPLCLKSKLNSSVNKNMSDAEGKITDDIRNIFCRYKEKQKVDLFRTFNNILSCDCGHNTRIKNVRCRLLWYKKMTLYYRAVMMALALILLLLLYAIWAGRRYNHARTYGTGACVSTFFWTYNDCLISF